MTFPVGKILTISLLDKILCLYPSMAFEKKRSGVQIRLESVNETNVSEKKTRQLISV